MKKLEKYFKFSFSALSDFKELKNSEIYSKISKSLNVHPEQILHIGDHWEFDYLSARKAGMNAIYLDRSNTKNEKYIINNLGEVKKIIEDINQ
jgi:putative hydrolase of the HAD superfamily